ncbi:MULTISPECIES: mechanosensitive ion channel family protein [unclassified Synechococcus]|uniref:mechanosensitive ion channel family protein n=1 Tax=unclassified Synechococcus TaxID=2626047 RepID=UPI001E4EFE57|nr:MULTISPECIES: mechanosensitive ion channel domain-containing protein [unclassified Synechococcus]
MQPKQIEVLEDNPYTLIGIRGAGSDPFLRLMAVDDRVAQCFDLSRQQLAIRYRDQLRGAISSYRSNNSLSSWLRGTALALLVLGIYVLWIRWQAALHTRLQQSISQLDGIRLGRFQIGTNALLSTAQITRVLTLLLRFVHWGLLLLISYLLIPLLLGLFPPTSAMAEGLREQLLSVVSAVFNGVVSSIPDLLAIVLILALTIGVMRLSTFCFRALERGHLRFAWFYPEWARPTGRIAAVLILVGGLVIAYPYIPGTSTKAFQGAGLFVGVLAALGSSAIASNIISGLMLIYTRAFTEGDRVMIDGVVGLVQERDLLVTRIRTPRNELVSIPNAAVIAASVTNYSFSRRELSTPVALSTTITIGYDVPWRKVHELMLSAARSAPGISEEIEPFVLQTALNDFHISYELTAFVKDVDLYRRTLSDVLAALQDCFAAAEVEILSPGYHAIRNGNASTLPKGEG